MATSPETRIEAALISQVAALSYISTNSISVRSMDDMAEQKADSLVRVSCGKAERHAPNYNFYRTEVEITGVTHIPNDEADSVSENIYEEVNEYVQNLAVSAINASITGGTVEVDGIVPQQGDTEYDDNWRMKSVRMDMHYTYSNLWTPAETTTAIWLDANKSSTITHSSGAISQINDRSGNSRHVVQSTGSKQPTYSSGKITFDGTADAMSTSAAATWLDGVKYNVFAYHNGYPVDGTARRLCGTTGGANAGLQVGYAGSFTWADAHFADDGTVSYGGSATDVVTLTSFTNPGFTLYANGNLVATNGTAPANPLSGAGAFNLGAGQSDTSNNYSGEINELVIITGALTTAIQEKVEGYLAWKWDGINGNTTLVTALPVSHTYKSAAPTV